MCMILKEFFADSREQRGYGWFFGDSGEICAAYRNLRGGWIFVPCFNSDYALKGCNSLQGLAAVGWEFFRPLKRAEARGCSGNPSLATGATFFRPLKRAEASERSGTDKDRFLGTAGVGTPGMPGSLRVIRVGLRSEVSHPFAKDAKNKNVARVGHTEFRSFRTVRGGFRAEVSHSFAKMPANEWGTGHS
jgi:hypothetical protein